MRAPVVRLIVDSDPTRCRGLKRMCNRCKNHGVPDERGFWCHLHADQRAWMVAQEDYETAQRTPPPTPTEDR